MKNRQKYYIYEKQHQTKNNNISSNSIIVSLSNKEYQSY